MSQTLVNDNPIDRIEALALENLPLVECKTEHFFVPDIYVRRFTMPSGTLVTSKIHLQRHPFFIIKGDVSVWTENEGWNRFSAPYCGITEPGTRRVLVSHEETIWLTFQNTCLTDPEAIECALIEAHDNPLVPKEIANAVQSLCRGDVRYLPPQERIH